MYDTTHYVALMNRLSNEKDYLTRAVGSEAIKMRKVWISQIEKEIAQEVEFLKSKGIDVYADTSVVDSMSDDDLMNELLG